jgi:hypothetical protein
MREGHVVGLLTSAIARVRRINYVQPDGNREASEGPIELTLDNGAVFRLESSSDGESLRLSIGEWEDLFAEPLSPENRDFAARSGKWAAFDVSHEGNFARLIGQKIIHLGLLTREGKIVGAELLFESTILRTEVRADELFVDLRDDHRR